MRINTNKGWRLTHKYLPERESPRGESGLHRRSPDLTPELQRAVWADEVVVAAQELEMFFELAAPPDDGRRPEARPHLNRRKNPVLFPSSSVGEESLSPNHPDTSSRF